MHELELCSGIRDGCSILWLPMHMRIHGAYYVLDLGTWPIARRQGKDKEQAPQSILPTGRHLCAFNILARQGKKMNPVASIRIPNKLSARSGSYLCHYCRAPKRYYELVSTYRLG